MGSPCGKPAAISSSNWSSCWPLVALTGTTAS
ncbi:Uncharacterised protein [Bordetella pertussis]|nr:Uncharacterised protein [Bordetella pertussis]